MEQSSVLVAKCDCPVAADCKTGLLKTYSAAFLGNMDPLKSRFGKMSGASRVQRYRATHIQLETIFTQAEPIFLWKSSNLVPCGLEGTRQSWLHNMYSVVCTALFCFVLHALPCSVLYIPVCVLHSAFIVCFAFSFSSIPFFRPSLRAPFFRSFLAISYILYCILPCTSILISFFPSLPFSLLFIFLATSSGVNPVIFT